MSPTIRRLILTVALSLLSVPLAYAQGSTTAPLTGVVVDTGGGVIPGATVTVAPGMTPPTVSTTTPLSGAVVEPCA